MCNSIIVDLFVISLALWTTKTNRNKEGSLRYFQVVLRHLSGIGIGWTMEYDDLIPSVLSLLRESTLVTAGHVSMHANPSRTEGGSFA